MDNTESMLAMQMQAGDMSIKDLVSMEGFSVFTMINGAGSCATSRLIQCRYLGVTSLDITECVEHDASTVTNAENDLIGTQKLIKARVIKAMKKFNPKYGSGVDGGKDGWICILFQWAIVEGYATTLSDFGGMVFTDMACRRFLSINVSYYACPGSEKKGEEFAHTLFCILKYIGFNPEFVAYCDMFREDGDDFYLDAEKLLDRSLSPEDIHAYMNALPCSIQRHPHASCVSKHGLPPSTRLYGAVHEGNYQKKLSKKALRMMDSVLARDKMVINMMRELRHGKTGKELAEQVMDKDKEEDGVPPDGTPYGMIIMCKNCHKTAEEAKIKQLNRCGRCMIARYCSRACQREHWKIHKYVCVDDSVTL